MWFLWLASASLTSSRTTPLDTSIPSGEAVHSFKAQLQDQIAQLQHKHAAELAALLEQQTAERASPSPAPVKALIETFAAQQGSLGVNGPGHPSVCTAQSAKTYDTLDIPGYAYYPDTQTWIAGKYKGCKETRYGAEYKFIFNDHEMKTYFNEGSEQEPGRQDIILGETVLSVHVPKWLYTVDMLDMTDENAGQFTVDSDMLAGNPIKSAPIHTIHGVKEWSRFGGFKFAYPNNLKPGTYQILAFSTAHMDPGASVSDVTHGYATELRNAFAAAEEYVNCHVAKIA